MAFYITGTSRSGKSSVCAKLQSLGYQAYDTDESINEWHDRKTGQLVTFVSSTPAETTKWVREHDFLMSEYKIEELFSEAKNNNVFICGHASNDIDFMRYFTKTFCLLISEEEARRRLASRSNNSRGNNSEQLKILMKWYKPTVERYKCAGAIIIEADRPIEKVVGYILKQTKT